MVSSLIWRFRQLSRRLWIRAALISAMSLVAAAIAPWFSGILPDGFARGIDEAAAMQLLNILTSTMLTVTTFSLSVMVTTHLNADGNATPRSHQLLQQDTRTHTVLATFLGAFVYALTLIVMIEAAIVSSADYAAIYVITILVIALVVIAILRWIAHLSGLGSLEETIRRVEERAMSSARMRVGAPYLGGVPCPMQRSLPDGTTAVLADRFGYIQHIDTQAISAALEEDDAQYWVAEQPGGWVNEGEVLGYVSGPHPRTLADRIRAATTLGDMRSYDQDTAYGLIVLSEVAERALSPGINDPKTAIDVLVRQTKLYAFLFNGLAEAEAEVTAPRVHVPPFDASRVLEETVDVIARDGRSFVEVMTGVQRIYRALEPRAPTEVQAAIRVLSGRALAYAENGLLLAADLARVRKLALVSDAVEILPDPVAILSSATASDAKDVERGMDEDTGKT